MKYSEEVAERDRLMAEARGILDRSGDNDLSGDDAQRFDTITAQVEGHNANIRRLEWADRMAHMPAGGDGHIRTMGGSEGTHYLDGSMPYGDDMRGATACGNRWQASRSSPGISRWPRGHGTTATPPTTSRCRLTVTSADSSPATGTAQNTNGPCLKAPAPLVGCWSRSRSPTALRLGAQPDPRVSGRRGHRPDVREHPENAAAHQRVQPGVEA